MNRVMSDDKVQKINEIVKDFFEKNTDKEMIAAKHIMPFLVEAGVFEKDVKKGMPLRKLLRAMDKENTLDLIPLVHAERKEESIYWYFVREGGTFVPLERPLLETRKYKTKERIANSDENYILELCDELLGVKSTRQHTFGFLKGDLHQNGSSRTKLPLDAYFHKLKLVLDFVDRPYSEEKAEEMERLTVSGVTRAEQRKIYRERKRTELKTKNLLLIELDTAAFELDEDQKIVRNDEANSKILSDILASRM